MRAETDAIGQLVRVAADFHVVQQGPVRRPQRQLGGGDFDLRGPAGVSCRLGGQIQLRQADFHPLLLLRAVELHAGFDPVPRAGLESHEEIGDERPGRLHQAAHRA